MRATLSASSSSTRGLRRRAAPWAIPLGLLALAIPLTFAHADPAAADPAAAPEAAPAPEAAAPAAEPAAAAEPAPTPKRPDWLSAEEAAFLDETGGMRPVASYDQSTGVVAIKLKKPGVSVEDIFRIAIGPTYDYYTRTDMVETSFRGSMEGKNYLFTGTVARTYLGNMGITLAFVPVVTQFTQRRTPEGIEINWVRAPEAEARAFLDLYGERLSASMASAKVDMSLEEYKTKVFDFYKDSAMIKGRHVYDIATGYYLYEQKAVMASDIAQTLATKVGQGPIKSAALKIAYQCLGEPARAGGPGEEGPKVVDMSGARLAPGR